MFRWKTSIFTLALGSMLAFPAIAGQVRVDVSSNIFTPRSVNLNLGDQVVWVWTGGSHSVTSGDSSNSPVTDGLFGTPTIGTFSGNGTHYTWKSSVTGTRLYYCMPHAPAMAGRLIIASSGIAVADFRITEVQYGAAGGLDRIEIANLGDAAGDLGRYRILVTAATQVYVPLASVVVAPGGRVTVLTNQTGTSTATNLFMNTLGDLPTTGSVALYAAYRTSTTLAAPLNSDLIVDFVQWTAGGQPNEAIASAAGLWTSGQAVNGESNPAYSISFCGTRADHGSGFWNVTTANFGSSGLCTTPTLNTSWGRIKVLYR